MSRSILSGSTSPWPETKPLRGGMPGIGLQAHVFHEPSHVVAPQEARALLVVRCEHVVDPQQLVAVHAELPLADLRQLRHGLRGRRRLGPRAFSRAARQRRHGIGARSVIFGARLRGPAGPLSTQAAGRCDEHTGGFNSALGGLIGITAKAQWSRGRSRIESHVTSQEVYCPMDPIQFLGH